MTNYIIAALGIFALFLLVATIHKPDSKLVPIKVHKKEHSLLDANKQKFLMYKKYQHGNQYTLYGVPHISY